MAWSDREWNQEVTRAEEAFDAFDERTVAGDDEEDS